MTPQVCLFSDHPPTSREWWLGCLSTHGSLRHEWQQVNGSATGLGSRPRELGRSAAGAQTQLGGPCRPPVLSDVNEHGQQLGV